MKTPLHILYLEDNENDALLVQSALDQEGFECRIDRVETRADFAAALERGTYDIIFSDFTLPSFDGESALNLVIGKGIDTPFIYVSGTIGEGPAIESLLHGATDYVLKGTLSRLVPSVRRALRESEEHRDRMKIQQSLRQSEERFRILFESAPDAYFLTDEKGTFVDGNKAAERLSGYERNELKGKNFLSLHLLPDSDLKHAAQNLARSAQDQPVGTEEFTLERKNGEVVSVEIRNLPVTIHDEKLILGIARDITERKRTQELVLQSERQFRLIAENVADMIAVLDLKCRRIYNSPSYRSILGDPESLKGTDGYQEIHPDDRERVKRVFEETVKTGVGQRIEYRLMRKDGSERTIDSKGGVIRDRDGMISQVIVVSRDVTEEKRLTAQLLRSQRMESIGTLAGGIAHDLNNVLAPIMMAIEILRSKMPDPAGQRIVNTIETSAKRGADIVRQVLAFGRGVNSDRIPVQLRHVVDEVVNIAGETFPKSIEIRTNIPRDLWTVSADPTQMHQVLLNLLVNARDAMPGGGTLEISAKNVILDENYSRMQLEARPGTYVCIVVNDTGTGIPSDIREKIFEPFFTTKEIGKGTGLGLSTTLAIVKSHEGFINLESDVGKGTTFRIYIPATGTTSSEAAATGEADYPMGNGELILIIDDEASIREITKETLEAHGYRTVTAGNGAEGVAIFAENKKDIKVVITDLMMPVMDGTAAILALKRIRPDVKIIAASGFTTSEQITTQSDPNVQAFLTKPYTAESLLKTLRTVLG